MPRITVVAVGLALAMLGGCGPLAFLRSDRPPTAEIALRAGVTPDQAYERTGEVLARRFVIETAQRGAEPGIDLIRTAWSNTWDGKTYENYRFRIEVRAKRDARRLLLRCDGQALDGQTCSDGWCDVVLTAVENELRAAVGVPASACPG